jgi:hypothetical protein
MKPICPWCQVEQKLIPIQGQTHITCDFHKAKIREEIRKMTIDQRIELEKQRRGEA